jgi:large subunit ribosomal protein L28
MSRVCSITQSKPSLGHTINRSGKAKKKGGIGTHVTGNTRRTISPNLRSKRLWVPELGKHVRVKLTARALKSLDRKGVYATLKEAGVL